MILKVVAYFDKKLGVYSNPIFLRNDSNEDIQENYRRMLASSKVPAEYRDYDVYILGSYEDKRAEFKVCEKPEYLLSMADFMSSEEVKEDVARS